TILDNKNNSTSKLKNHIEPYIICHFNIYNSIKCNTIIYYCITFYALRDANKLRIFLCVIIIYTNYFKIYRTFIEEKVPVYSSRGWYFKIPFLLSSIILILSFSNQVI